MIGRRHHRFATAPSLPARFDRPGARLYNNRTMSGTKTGLSYESSGVNYDVLDAFKRACQRSAATTSSLSSTFIWQPTVSMYRCLGILL